MVKVCRYLITNSVNVFTSRNLTTPTAESEHDEQCNAAHISKNKQGHERGSKPEIQSEAENAEQRETFKRLSLQSSAQVHYHLLEEEKGGSSRVVRGWQDVSTTA